MGNAAAGGQSAAMNKLRDMYKESSERGTELQTEQTEQRESGMFEAADDDDGTTGTICFQLHHKYIVTSIRSGVVLIHQQRAHERVLYEHYVAAMAHNASTTQQELFPETLRFSGGDAELLRSILPEVRQLGFDIEEMGKQGFVVNGTPVDAAHSSPKELLETMLEQYKLHEGQGKLNTSDRLARSLAATLAIQPGQNMHPEEMQHLVDGLFGCEVPAFSPTGKATIVSFTLADIDEKFD